MVMIFTNLTSDFAGNKQNDPKQTKSTMIFSDLPNRRFAKKKLCHMALPFDDKHEIHHLQARRLQMTMFRTTSTESDNFQYHLDRTFRCSLPPPLNMQIFNTTSTENNNFQYHL